MESYISPYGIPERIVTDQGTAFTGQGFKKFCGRLNIDLLYSTPNIHTRTGLVERTIGSLKQLIKAFLSEGVGLKEALIRALGNLRLTPHSKIKITPFELHFGRRPNTELRNLMAKGISNYSCWGKIIDQLKCPGYNVSEKPHSILIYAFSAGRQVDTLPFIQTPKSMERREHKRTPVSKYVLEKNARAKAYDHSYHLNPKRVIAESKHTYTTEDNRIIHKKLSTRVKKPEIFQRPYNRLVDHSQKMHRDRFGRFASPGRGQAVTLKFLVRNADVNEREFSNSSTPEREIPQEPEVDASPVRHQAEARNIRELGKPPALNTEHLGPIRPSRRCFP